MKKRLFAGIFTLCLILSGCSGNEAKNPGTQAFPIEIKEHISPAAVGDAYDLTSLITLQDDIDYEFTATYQDPTSGETQQLNVRRDKITPKAEADITVTIQAIQGENISSAQVILPVKTSADIMDALLAEQALQDVTATVTKETTYGDISSSAVEYSFSDTATIAELTDYKLHAYFSAQVWRNAAVSFWAYNPMQQEVTLQLIGNSCESPKLSAQAGQWTHIAFSLYDMGITEPLADSPLFTTTDRLQLIACSAGENSCKLIIDQLDIVHAETVEGLTTGYTESAIPAGNYSDLLASCRVYTEDSIAKLEKLSANSYRFGSNQATGYPTFFIDFPMATDISGFDYLKFDVLAENAYPHLTVAVRYLDEDGNVKHKGTSYDYYVNEWQTIYVNLDYLHGVDLTKAVGVSIAVHMDGRFVTGQYNTVSFRNMSLYEYPQDEPQMSPAILEDNDLISGSFYTANTKPNTSGVCKVATDENGDSRSNSTLLFWTNNACGYPVVDATFMFDTEQDWSDKSILSFDTHQFHGHYWLQLTILYLDDEGNEKSAIWYFDTLLTNWKTNHASFEWFEAEDGTKLTPQMLDRVVGLRVAPNMAINVTDEVALIYFDNFVLS